MKAINWGPKHAVVLVLLVAICVGVFPEQSCYGRELYKRPTVKGTFKVQMRAVNDMSLTIKEVVDLHKRLKSNLRFRTPQARKEYDKLLENIQRLNGDLKDIEEQIEELDNTKTRLLDDVNDLQEKEKELGERVTGLSTQVSDLEGEKKVIEDENNELLGDVNDLRVDVNDLEGEKKVIEGKNNELLVDVNDLEGDKEELNAEIESLESTKRTIMAWFGGGFGTSLTGIILLVLKITSQKKDIKLKQIQIDKIEKKN